MIMFANAGLPMLMVGMPLMILLLLPIVAIEAWWYRWFLNVTWREAWTGSWKANAWSTFIGIPLTWLVLIFVELFLLSMCQINSHSPILAESYAVSYFYFLVTSPLLMPYRDGLPIIMTGAFMVMLVPAYLVSYIGEANVLRKSWITLNKQAIRKHCWYVHMVTYGLLLFLAWLRLSTMSQ